MCVPCRAVLCNLYNLCNLCNLRNLGHVWNVSCWGPQSHFAQLQRGADTKRKRYRCVVWVSVPMTPAAVSLLNSTTNLKVLQDTPGA